MPFDIRTRRCARPSVERERRRSPTPCAACWRQYRRGVEVEAVASTSTYRELVDRLKQRIRESQARAARALNTELVMLYWSIGRDILAQQQAAGWGDDIVGRIAEDLRVETGSARGFSRRNLFYMRRLAAVWPEAEKVQTLSAQIGWSHHQVLLDAWAD